MPLGPILDAADIFADPHFRARDMLPTVTHPHDGRAVTVPGIPAKLSHTPGTIERRAPLVGEHTVEILREAGLDTAELTALADAGATVIPSSAQEHVA